MGPCINLISLGRRMMSGSANKLYRNGSTSSCLSGPPRLSNSTPSLSSLPLLKVCAAGVGPSPRPPRTFPQAQLLPNPAIILGWWSPSPLLCLLLRPFAVARRRLNLLDLVANAEVHWWWPCIAAAPLLLESEASRARGAATQPVATFKQQHARIAAELLQRVFIVSLMGSPKTQGRGQDQVEKGCCWSMPALAANDVLYPRLCQGRTNHRTDSSVVRCPLCVSSTEQGPREF